MISWNIRPGSVASTYKTKPLSPAMVRALAMVREGRGECAPLRTLYALRDRGLVTVRAHYCRHGKHTAGGEPVQVTVTLTSGAS